MFGVGVNDCEYYPKDGPQRKQRPYTPPDYDDVLAFGDEWFAAEEGHTGLKITTHDGNGAGYSPPTK